MLLHLVPYRIITDLKGDMMVKLYKNKEQVYGELYPMPEQRTQVAL